MLKICLDNGMIKRLLFSRFLIYAHTPSKTGWHELSAHLKEVAHRAGRFAEPFGCEDLAFWLGALHDIGKINPRFQDYLQALADGKMARKTRHSIWGAALLYQVIGQMNKDDGWKELGLPILGHHGSLPDGGVAAQSLLEFLEKEPAALQAMKSYLEKTLLKLPSLKVSPLPALRRELRIRMLFSALVDADWLDTEQHFEPGNAKARKGLPDLALLWRRFQVDQRELFSDLQAKRKHDTPVNRSRREVYEACLAAAFGPPGVYRLTVPTGGGKTRSGLAFALRHALKNGLCRIVVAIPYTSIIDQTVQVYREILGDEAVLEHHSQVQVPEHDEDQSPAAVRLQLATENWDAPLIVTTTVQLFDSLFSNRRNRVRKLHNLAESVIVLDEVQTLPPELLAPTLDVLRTLVEEYKVSLVLSTATQPTFEEGRYLQAFSGLEIREIVPQFRQYFERLRRVTYERRTEPPTWEELAEEVHDLPQVMVVLNARKDALALLDALGKDQDAFHLSTLLCGTHRRVVLEEVRRRLKEGRTVRLVSTQVVEAGVDLDFPVVYRAIGPLDRIVQVAGRCNREGKLCHGRVVIFEPAGGRAPGGPYKVGMEKAKLLLHAHSIDALHDPEIYREYFRRLYNDVDTDRKGIQGYRETLNYPEVAERFHLIDQDTVAVVVPYEDGFERLTEWQSYPSRRAWQQLQPYLVSLYRREAVQLEEEGWLIPISEGFYRWEGGYDPTRGIVSALRDPADLVWS